MRLTVGPLPTAVYWRRRALLLGGMLVAVSLLWVSFATVSKSAPPTKRTATSSSPHPSPSASASALLSPITPGTLDSLPAATTAAPPPPANQPVQPAGSTPATAACADTEILLTPLADRITAPRGATLALTLKVKNISTHPCSRDLGADPQELYVQQGTEKIWSSDACNPLHGSNVQTLGPGEEQAFFVSWVGTKATNNGCDDRQPPAAGKYQLFGRLATKISEPLVLTLT